jgi:adenylate cyclase
VETIGKHLRRLWAHRIVRVGAAFLAAGWAAFQVAVNVGQTLHLPDWVAKLVLVTLVLGFPLALILAWASRGGPAPRPVAALAPPPVPEAMGPKPIVRDGLACIAVLPFANFSRKAADEIFADGIVEDLITSLSLNSALRVISRSSTFAYKGRSPDVREVGADLGASFVLEGSVRRAGERLRLTAQLVETETGAHLWAEQYDRAVADLFQLQDDLVLAIAAALGAELDRAELRRVRRNPTSISAWEEAMRSNYLHERPSLTALPIAIGHARKAVELDPNFAMGHARLGLSLSTAAQMLGEGPGGPNRLETISAIHRAVALSPNDPQILGIASTALSHAGLPEEGLRHGLRAIELNPHDATYYGSVGNAMYRSGRAAEAFAYYDEEERLAPKSIWLNGRYLYRAMAYLVLGRLDEACAAVTRTLERDPAFEQAWCMLAGIEGMRGNPEAAVEAVIRLRELNPKAPLAIWAAALANNLAEPTGPAAAKAFTEAWVASETSAQAGAA